MVDYQQFTGIERSAMLTLDIKSHPMNSRQLSYLLGAVAVIIALIAVAYFAYGRKPQDQTLSNQNTGPNTNTVTTDSNKPANVNNNKNTNHSHAPADETANWKTYTGTGDPKFSIQYPPDWTVETPTGLYGEKVVTIDSGYQQKIGVVSISSNSSNSANIRYHNTDCNDGTKEQVQLKNQALTMCHSLGNTQQPEGYYYDATAPSGTIYSIGASIYPGGNNRSMILKILSTLRLTN